MTRGKNITFFGGIFKENLPPETQVPDEPNGSSIFPAQVIHV